MDTSQNKSKFSVRRFFAEYKPSEIEDTIPSIVTEVFFEGVLLARIELEREEPHNPLANDIGDFARIYSDESVLVSEFTDLIWSLDEPFKKEMLWLLADELAVILTEEMGR